MNWYHSLYRLQQWLQSTSFAYGLVAVFLFAQTAALIHTEIHPFHEHSAQCDVYAGVEHQAADTPSVFLIPILIGFAITFVVMPTTHFFSVTFASFQARAPPASFSF